MAIDTCQHCTRDAVYTVNSINGKRFRYCARHRPAQVKFLRMHLGHEKDAIEKVSVLGWGPVAIMLEMEIVAPVEAEENETTQPTLIDQVQDAFRRKGGRPPGAKNRPKVAA